MSKRFYKDNYLENTAELLSTLKKTSYSDFEGFRNETIIDVGCGTGVDLEGLSCYLDASNRIIGVEIDPGSYKKATSKTSNFDNVDVLNSDILTVELKNNSIKGFRFERVFQHLDRTPEVLNIVFDKLIKGGVLSIIETDWAGLTFYSENTHVEQKVKEYFSLKKVRNGLASRVLPSSLNKKGFEILDIKNNWINLSGKEEINSIVELQSVIAEANSFGYISDTERISMINEIENLHLKNQLRLSINLIHIIAIK